MRDKGYGRIISTLSSAGTGKGQANYGAAKMGLVGFTEFLPSKVHASTSRECDRTNALTRMTEDLLGDLGQNCNPTMLPHFAPPTNAMQQAAFSGGGRVAEVFIGECQGFTDANLSPNVATLVDDL